MTREEAQKAIKDNSIVFYVISKDFGNKRWIIASSEARMISSVILDIPHSYHFDPKDAVIEFCMNDVENLTRQIQECKESVKWKVTLSDKITVDR